MRTLDRHTLKAPPAKGAEHEAVKAASGLATFFAKINSDMIFIWSGNLAYSFLTSIFPLMLVLLAIAGFALGRISPVTLSSLENSIANALPSGIGHVVVKAATTSLQRSAGLILVIGVITSLFAGSRLFVAIETSFNVVFRLHPRSFIRQNVVAILMTLLFVVGGPLLFLASIIPTLILKSLTTVVPGPLESFLVQVAGLVAGFIVAAALFAAIYVVMPNQKVIWHDVWKGAAVAAGALVIYELLFPIYESLLLHPGNYGSLAGFVILILVFFFYLSFILMLGAEVNAWVLGQRTPSDTLVIYTKPAKAEAPQAPAQTPPIARQPSSNQSVALNKRRVATATATVTGASRAPRGGEPAPQRQSQRAKQGGQRQRGATASPTQRTRASAYVGGAGTADETASGSFSLITTLAAALTALSVIAFQLARRPRHA